MFCFRQFEDWIFQPPLNLLMFKFLTGRHSKALQGSWNLRSLLTRDMLSWAEGSQMWLQPGSQNQKGRSTSNYLNAASCSAHLEIPFYSRPPSFCFLGKGFGSQEGFGTSSIFWWRICLPTPCPTLGEALTAFLWLCHSQLEEGPAWR